MPQLELRPITETDWPVILHLQAEAYYLFAPEDEVVLRSKTRLGPETCMIACLGPTCVGYCFAHPWKLGFPPSLDCCYEQPLGTECLYIHDVVVAPQARGLGVAQAFFQQLERLAQSKAYRQMALVAVQGADRYWSRLGFAEVATRKDLSGYGAQAVYMQKPVATVTKTVRLPAST